MNNEFKDYYKILGVKPDASENSIRDRADEEYRIYMKINPQKAAEKLEAGDVLLYHRKEYDEIYKQMISERDNALNSADSKESMENLPKANELKEEPKVVAPDVTLGDVPKEGIPGEKPTEENVEEEVKPEEVVPAKENVEEEVKPEEAVPAEEKVDLEDPKEAVPAEENVEEDPEEAVPAEENVEEEVKPEEAVPAEENVEEEVKPEEAVPAEENVEEEVKPEEERIIEIDEVTPGLASRIAKKTWSFVNKNDRTRKALTAAGIIVVSSAVLGVPGVLLSIPVTLISSKIGNKIKKYKLKKENNPKKLTEFETKEAKIFETYNKNLEKQIESLLAQKNTNYELEIAILKYKNQVELLKARIDHKKEQTVTKVGMLKYKIELKSLERQLESSEITRDILEEKVKKHNKETKLTKLNDELYKKDAELTETRSKEKEGKLSSKDKFKVKNLEVDFNALKRARDKKANKMILHRKGISNRQAFLVAFDVVKKKVSNFFERRNNPATGNQVEEVQPQVVENQEEENVKKTR